MIRYDTLQRTPRDFAVAAFAVLLPLFGALTNAQQPQANGEPSRGEDEALQTRFREQIQPLLQKHCLRCHDQETMKSGIRVDRLDGTLEDRQLFLWQGILQQVHERAMPPEDEPQPSDVERQVLAGWIGDAITLARTRERDKNGLVRRLTVSQYRNTLRDLLGLEDELTDILPPDAVSKEGFANHAPSLLLSPLLVEAYFAIAERALDRCIVDEQLKPVIQNFRMDLGAGINRQPCPDSLVLGAFSHLLRNEDFLVTQRSPAKPFDYEPFKMRTKYRFIEGYQGNDTVRGWREYDSIYHAVFACMRGMEGYPKGLAYQSVPEGLLLRPAIPSAELFQVESTYGPRANFKISLRELPDDGKFRVTVTAARYDDGLLLDAGSPLHDAYQSAAVVVSRIPASGAASLMINEAGIYQVDVYVAASDETEDLSLQLGERHFAGQLWPSAPKTEGGESDEVEVGAAFLLVRLPAGPLTLQAKCGDKAGLRRVILTRAADDSEAAQRFRVFERRVPRLGVHLGLRRDCGSTLTQVGRAQPVSSRELEQFIFEGAISNFPNPDVEADNVNYLAGIREIGVRSEYTDGRDMPRLLLRSVEFEGPFYDAWPPATHRNIFIDSKHQANPAVYANEILRSFATRAYRRPVTDAEADQLLGVWSEAFAEHSDFQQSIKDALLVVLTSPQFLFLIENSASPAAEPLGPYELASKLSYFLWNTAPDERLLELAAAKRLHESLDAETRRMVQDPRFGQFMQQFATQWLSLDKLDVVEVDRQRYPRLTRDTKAQLRQEPVEFLRYLVQGNLPLRNLVQSDFILANEVVASYYDLGERTESGFEFVPIPHDNAHLGGVLSQAGILAGLSDGRHANPVKRGAWLARKIIAEPPDDPPPNVPALPDDDGSQLTLREKLERHRSQEGCAKCHSGIDPWGLPLEQFDAGGRFIPGPEVDARSTLPDATTVSNANELKAYLADDRIDQVAFSFLKHLACYATGRSLTYNEIEFLREKGLELKPTGYRMEDMLRFVVQSPLFLEK